MTNHDIPHKTICYVDQSSGKLSPPTPLVQVLATLDTSTSSLIVVDGNKEPPICRVVPNETLFPQRSTSKDKKPKKQLADKTVTLKWNVAPNDLNRKLESAKKFLIKGHRVNLVFEGPFNGDKQAKEAALNNVRSQFFDLVASKGTKEVEVPSVKVKEWQRPKFTFRETVIYLQPQQ